MGVIVTRSNLIVRKFNPVDLALQLLDDSKGKNMASFRDTKDMLSRALKGSVDSMSVVTPQMRLHDLISYLP